MSSKFLSVLFLSALFLFACGEDIHVQNKRAYDAEMKGLAESIAVDPAKLDNLWALSGVATFYKDKFDSQYDAYIYEKHTTPETYLFMKGGRFLRAHLNRLCVPSKSQPQTPWFLELGFDPSNPDGSRSNNPTEFLNFIATEEKLQSDWHPFTLENQTLVTKKFLRSALETANSDVETRVTLLRHEGKLESDELDLVFINHAQPEGVHTVKETFRSIGGKELTKILAETQKILSGCPKR